MRTTGPIERATAEVQVYSDIRSVADAWDELSERIQAVPWIRRGWIEAWLDVFGGRAEIYLQKNGDRVAGLLPLVRRGSVLRSPTNWHTPAFAPLADDETAVTQLLDAVLRTHPRRLDLRFLPEEAVNIEDLRDRAEIAGYRVLRRIMIHSPYISLEGSWEDYEKRLARKLRNDLRRCLRRLEERGDVSIETEIESGDGHAGHLDQLLEEGFRIEGSGWKDSRGTAITSHVPSERFYRSIARWACDQGWLRLAFLRLDGRAVAFDLFLELNGVLYNIKGGYDRDFARYSPGKILLREVLCRAFARGLTRFEFLGALEPYKLAWTSTAHARWSLQAFAHSFHGVAEWAAFQYGRPVAKRILSVMP
jgi:CelD/BcsL family acetyltransferase involved in cellulose biosynthesis